VPTALVIADLEGIAGVDDLDALMAGSKAHRRGRALYEAEVGVCVEALAAAGFDRVVVSDSHRSGAPRAHPARRCPSASGRSRVDRGRIRSGAVRASQRRRLHRHARRRRRARLRSPQPSDLNAVWLLDGRPLSETDIVAGLSAEHGLPLRFVAGDAAVATVAVKRSQSPEKCVSVAPEKAHELIRAAARAGGAVPARLGGQLCLRFKSRWMAEVVSGSGRRIDSVTVAVPGKSFRDRYHNACAMLEMLSPFLLAALRTFDPALLRTDVRTLLLRSIGPAPAARLHRPRSPSPVVVPRSLRGPGALAARRSRPHAAHARGPRAGLLRSRRTDRRARRVGSRPRRRPPLTSRSASSPPRRWRGSTRSMSVTSAAPPISLDDAGLGGYIRSIAETDGVFAWLLGELASQIGGTQPLSLEPRPFRHERLPDLYWLTHLFLLETRYLRRPLPARGFESELEELFLAVPEIRTQRWLDIAAEVAFCLQAAGETDSHEHVLLLECLAEHQEASGQVRDPSAEAAPDDAARVEAHVTAAATLAFAGATR